RWIRADGHRTLRLRLHQRFVPLRPVRPNRRHRLQAGCFLERSEQRLVAGGRITMERARQMSDPGAIEAIALDYALEDFRIRVWNVPERIRPDECVAIDQERIPRGVYPEERGDESAGDDTGNAFFGKIRVAFFHRMFSRSSPLTPITSSARSFA